jgi:hypothetical protein
MYKMCNTVDENWENVLELYCTKNCISSNKHITKILLNLQNMQYEAAVNILLKCYILATTDMLAGNTNDWQRLKHFL